VRQAVVDGTVLSLSANGGWGGSGTVSIRMPVACEQYSSSPQEKGAFELGPFFRSASTAKVEAEYQ
jgi:hypothetical protein